MIRGTFEFGTYERAGISYDEYHAFVAQVPRLVDLAREAASTEARSYRGFHVGAALFAVNETEKRVGVISAGNTKIDPDAPKFCAEMAVLQEAEINGLRKAVGLVVAGTTDRDEIEGVNGVSTHTLHPCEACRNLMERSPLVTDETLILSIGTQDDDYQIHTFLELKEFYDTNRGCGLQEAAVHYLDFDNWSNREFAYGLFSAQAEELKRTPAQLARLALSHTE